MVKLPQKFLFYGISLQQQILFHMQMFIGTIFE